jgi:hypothetical protein
MTLTLSKKDIAYFVAIAILLVTTSASFLAYKAGAQEEQNKGAISENSDSGLAENQETLSESDNGGTTPIETNILHLNCEDQVTFTDLPTSDTYISNAPYSHSFMNDGSLTQDLNGDNLPDYSYTNGEKTISGTLLTAITIGCTYLNNGNGWEEVYICYAKTRSDITTGIIDIAEYRGDCAGEPSVAE